MTSSPQFYSLKLSSLFQPPKLQDWVWCISQVSLSAVDVCSCASIAKNICRVEIARKGETWQISLCSWRNTEALLKEENKPKGFGFCSLLAKTCNDVVIRTISWVGGRCKRYHQFPSVCFPVTCCSSDSFLFSCSSWPEERHIECFHFKLFSRMDE